MSDSTTFKDSTCTASARLSALAPTFAARFDAARNLLLGGGWTQTPDHLTTTFADGQRINGGECSCQEDKHVVCLHELAVRLLAIAEQRPREGASA